jgi:hypothetical protein
LVCGVWKLIRRRFTFGISVLLAYDHRPLFTFVHLSLPLISLSYLVRAVVLYRSRSQEQIFRCACSQWCLLKVIVWLVIKSARPWCGQMGKNASATTTIFSHLQSTWIHHSHFLHHYQYCTNDMITARDRKKRLLLGRRNCLFDCSTCRLTSWAASSVILRMKNLFVYATYVERSTPIRQMPLDDAFSVTSSSSYTLPVLPYYSKSAIILYYPSMSARSP